MAGVEPRQSAVVTIGRNENLGTVLVSQLSPRCTAASKLVRDSHGLVALGQPLPILCVLQRLSHPLLEGR